MAILVLVDNGIEDLPPGTHPATFRGLSPCETQKGKAWRWSFVTDDGRRPTFLSDAESRPSPKNKTGRWLAGLAGRPVVAGLAVDPDEYVGRRYALIVGDGGKLVTLTALPSAPPTPVLPTIPSAETTTAGGVA